MGNFNREDRRGGSDRSFRRGGNDRPQMHQATCSDCGISCEVPFRPSGDKPVYCSDCFSNKDTSNASRNERRGNERTGRGDKPMFKAVCDSCHKDCEVPFRPTGDKPVYCSDCFGKTERRDGGRGERRDDGRNVSAGTNSSGSNKQQFEMLNDKLDKIMNILSGHISSEKPAEKKKVSAKKIVKEKPLEKKAAVKKVAKKPALKKEVKKVVKKAVPKKKVVAKKTAKKAVIKKK